MKTTQVKVKSLKPYWRNPRDNDETVEALKNTIRRHGFRQPVLIDENKVIVSGHARYRAAVELELEKVPCILVDDLTPEQIKEFRIVDNKIAELGRWDPEKLSRELKKLDNVAIMKDFGFENYELEELADFAIEEPVTEIPSAPREKNTIGGKGAENDDNEIILTCPECYHEHHFTKKELLAKRTGEDS